MIVFVEVPKSSPAGGAGQNRPGCSEGRPELRAGTVGIDLGVQGPAPNYGPEGMGPVGPLYV